jgi:hypothetical protein
VALKDLIVSHAELTEEQIEKIVAPYARYDLVAKSIVLLPSAMTLSNRQRVIVYLVALRGWPFVVSEDAPPTSATPAELERSLQIPGGTLRPILKDLRDARLIEATDGRYSANPVTLPFLEEELQRVGDQSNGARQQRPKARAARTNHTAPEVSSGATQESDEASPPAKTNEMRRRATRARRAATVAGGGPMARLQSLIREGWFAQPRTTQDILSYLEARGARYRGQDLTRQLLTLTRSGELKRQKRAPAGSGKPVWHYQQ